MTYEEARNTLDKAEDMMINAFSGYPYLKEERDMLTAIEIAAEALEKQIKCKPYKNKFGDYVCQICDDELGMVNYCPECGQLIDWSEMEAEG
jgi:hypothetical protein